MKKFLRRLLAITLTACIVSGTYSAYTLKVHAKTTQEKLDDAEKQKENLEQNVKDSKENVKELEKKKAEIKAEINALNGKLEEISLKIEELENSIISKKAEIAKTQEELDNARKIEAEQYDAMKKRIKFMYEDSSSLFLEIIFQAKSFSNFITLSNFIEALASYDRRKFDEYQSIRIDIENMEANLQSEKAELDELKVQTETEKAELVIAINDTALKLADYGDLLDDAEDELEEYEKELKQQNKTIEQLKKQIEEEKRLSELAKQAAWRDISEITFDEGDRYLLAVLIYCEAGGEPYEGKVAVASVVINRVLSSRYPSTVSGVIYQKWQFSPVASGRFAKYLAIGKTTQGCYNAADAAMSGYTNVGNCLYFRTPIEGLTGIQIGGHIFY